MVQKVIEIVNKAADDKQYPVPDTRFWALATGSKDYIMWVKEQTKEHSNDDEDISNFLPA
jgi:uncharacterized protein involved in tolerance to divalent cations